MPDDGCRIPDTGYKDTGYKIQDTGYKDTGYKDTGCSQPKFCNTSLDRYRAFGI